MAWWKRSRAVEESTPDRVYTNLTTDEVATIRKLAMEALAGLGVETVPDSDGTVLRATDGEFFGLDNLMARCTYLPRREWRSVIAEHYRALIEQRLEPLSQDLDFSELLLRVRSRVISQSQMDHTPENLSYAWPVAEGLTEVLCLDFPKTIRFMTNEVLAMHSAKELRAAGRRNTLNEPIDEVTVFGDGPGTFHLVYGGSSFVASKLLTLDSLLSHSLPEAPLGMVIGIPSRHYLAAHPLHSRDALLAVIEKMGTYCQLGNKNHPGPITGELYYWQPGHIQKITSTEPSQKHSTITLEGLFYTAYSELT